MKFIDQMKREVELDKPAQRIVSLVPSQTEFLFHLGLEKEVIGLTKFCVHPEVWWREKKRVGGTKNAKYDRVKGLQPDLIIGNKEENDQKNISDLSDIAPVWMSDIKTLEDAYEMMQKLGELTGREDEAAKLIQEIKVLFVGLKPISPAKKALYFIWKDPWMLAGKDTFISHLMNLCGFENMTNEPRYPMLDEESVEDVELIMLSSEPFPFKEKEVLELKSKYPNAEVHLVDGEMFSWYGSRMLKAPTYFSKLITSLE